MERDTQLFLTALGKKVDDLVKTVHDDVGALHDKVNTNHENVMKLMADNKEAIALQKARCDGVQERKKPWVKSAIHAIFALLAGAIGAVLTQVFGGD